MNAGEQLSALEMMGVDPIRRILGPAFFGLRHLDAAACDHVLLLSALSAAGSWLFR